MRLDRVKEMLVDSHSSIAELARLTGFEHPEYLGVVFKRRTGLTPGEYRACIGRPEEQRSAPGRCRHFKKQPAGHPGGRVSERFIRSVDSSMLRWDKFYIESEHNLHDKRLASRKIDIIIILGSSVHDVGVLPL